MADGKIVITGDLEFVGYKQKAGPGINRQRLTYVDGEAVWEDGAESIVTSGADQDVLIDNDGNVIESQLDTYVGIDTKPTANASTGGGTTYTFEDEGTAIPSQTNVNKLNFAGTGVSASLNTTDNTTLNIDVSSAANTYIFEDEDAAIVGSNSVSNINFTGPGVFASINGDDNSTLDVLVSGGEFGTATRGNIANSEFFSFVSITHPTLEGSNNTTVNLLMDPVIFDNTGLRPGSNSNQLIIPRNGMYRIQIPPLSVKLNVPGDGANSGTGGVVLGYERDSTFFGLIATGFLTKTGSAVNVTAVTETFSEEVELEIGDELQLRALVTASQSAGSDGETATARYTVTPNNSQIIAIEGPNISGHVIVNGVGTTLEQREALQFAGTGVILSDDSTNGRTVVTISAGGGGTQGAGSGALFDGGRRTGTGGSVLSLGRRT